MRGTLRRIFFSDQLQRFIPAYAGNILPTLIVRFFKTVHPRICGEHQVLNGKLRKGIGSSPHMRGTYIDVKKITDRTRFIPAYAGNIMGYRIERNDEGVHPRICGEHYRGKRRGQDIIGSSPHMRGTLCSGRCNVA